MHGLDVPMHGSVSQITPRKEQIAIGNLKAFCAGILKKLAPPLLKEIEAVRGGRAGLDPFTPRRNTRSTATSTPKKSKATAAESVLLKALGIVPDDLAVQDDALGQLRELFDSPIQEPHLKAIAAIFGKSVPFDLGKEEATRVAVLA